MNQKYMNLWRAECPPWCDGGHLGPDWNSQAHMGITSQLKSGPGMTPVLVRRKVWWFLPGETFIVEFSSGSRKWTIQFADDETLDDFLGRAFKLEADVQEYAGWLDAELDRGRQLSEIEESINVR